MDQKPAKSTAKTFTRRGFMATSGAVAGASLLPRIAASTGGRRIFTVYFDKAIGAMRAVEKIIP